MPNFDSQITIFNALIRVFLVVNSPIFDDEIPVSDGSIPARPK